MSVANPSSRDVKFQRDAMRVVEEHLAEREFNVTELCTCLGMSRVTLHRRMKRICNKSAGEYIREKRLLHAVDILQEGELSIQDVARMSGFFNQSYFSKCFKERFGVRPSEYH